MHGRVIIGTLPSGFVIGWSVSLYMRCYRNGMLRESQLSTRNMVSAVTEEFWRMVRGSINDQALHFKSKSLCILFVIAGIVLQTSFTFLIFAIACHFNIILGLRIIKIMQSFNFTSNRRPRK